MPVRYPVGSEKAGGLGAVAWGVIGENNRVAFLLEVGSKVVEIAILEGGHVNHLLTLRLRV